MFCLFFFLVETTALFFFSSSSSSSFFCVHHSLYSLRKNCAPLSLSLSSLKKRNTKEHEIFVLRDLDFTQEELITHHKKKKRTERSLFTLSLSLSFFFQKLISCFPAWFLPKRRGGVLFFFFISLLFFFLTLLLLCFDDDDDFEEEEKMCFSAFVRTVSSLFLERD